MRWGGGGGTDEVLSLDTKTIEWSTKYHLKNFLKMCQLFEVDIDRHFRRFCIIAAIGS